METSLILIFLGLLLTIPLIPALEREIRLWRRARRDYLKARGTAHRKILHKCLSSLDLKISGLEAKKESLLSRRTQIESQRKEELKNALTTYLVSTELDQLPGIGSVLKDRLILERFDGTLESLSAPRSVHGVGVQKHLIIRSWIEDAKLRMPQLLLGDFPSKADVMKKYRDLDIEVERELQGITMDQKSLSRLNGEATAAIANLVSVDASTFRAAYRGDRKAAETVTKYLIGVFPEWERIPSWFETLVKMDKAA